jgi:hypothetical protein
MKTRLGKIAQLPKPIRDDLNHRLENGKQSPELLEWLNALPETQQLITQKFDNQPITRSNLSDWRQGGFADWRADQIREARIQRICETGDTLEKAEAGDLFENFARMAVAEMVTDLDALQKLRGEKRAEHMHHLVRDLARLQNAYNRSRWADLAWTKYNDTYDDSGTGACRAEALAKADPPASSADTTPCITIPVVPDRAQSQAMAHDDGEPKPDGNGMYVLHFTNCNCHDPCPTCHAPDSDYPHADATRDHHYHRKYFRYPRDRHGKQKFLINFICDCACDRCAEKTATTASALNVIPACRAEALAEAGRAALPRCPIIHHADPRDETSSVHTNTTTPTPSIQLTDFSRRMALLKTVTQ